MHNDENAVIRYLMKEMDPSEEVLMERAMMEDDDLLIEVESMRQTLQRLDDLPDREPPADLSASVIRQAADQKNAAPWPHIPTQVYKYAAVLLIGVGIGSGVWLITGSSPSDATDATNAANIATEFNESAQKTNVEPWVDRENVIYYQDMFSRQASDYNAILETSMQKLTPVDGSFRSNTTTRNLQLTGSHN